MKSQATCYDELRGFLETVPLVDCHDHSSECGPRYTDPIQVVAGGYFVADLQSASSDADIARIQNASLSLEERWPILERAWKRTCHTGYAQVTRRVLSHFYGEQDLTYDALVRMQGKLADLTDEKTYDAILEEARIAARLTNALSGDVAQVLDGSLRLAPRARLVISLPGYHGVRDFMGVQGVVSPLKRKVTSLGEYLDACREIFEGWKRFGAVAFKDQSAYTRPLTYGNPSRAAAEEVFNWFMADPRRCVSYPDGAKPLDDYLFHEFMRMARDMELPVQIHTGHMAGVRNEILKTNAAALTSVLELHQDVRFDLFHANWPFGDELMFLGKNYPNVTLDFCWAQIIDPVYCRRLLQQALSCVPHGKIHAYGSDFAGNADRAWAHASIARDNIGVALAAMVEEQYLGLDDAKAVARAWMFDNPNAFFGLGLDAGTRRRG